MYVTMYVSADHPGNDSAVYVLWLQGHGCTLVSSPRDDVYTSFQSSFFLSSWPMADYRKTGSMLSTFSDFRGKRVLPPRNTENTFSLLWVSSWKRTWQCISQMIIDEFSDSMLVYILWLQGQESVKGQVQGEEWFLTRFPLKLTENDDVGETVIWWL